MNGRRESSAKIMLPTLCRLTSRIFYWRKCREIIENSGDLLVTIGRSLIHDAEKCDHVLQDRNSVVPYLQYFVCSLLTVLELNYKEDDSIVDEDKDTIVDKNACAYFWYFLAGLGIEANCNKLLKQYYQKEHFKEPQIVYLKLQSVTAQTANRFVFPNS